MLARSWRLLTGAALLSAVALATPAPAQLPGASPLPSLAITPYAGYQFGLTRTSSLRMRSDGAESLGEIAVRSGGGAVGGVQMAVPVDRLFLAPWAAGVVVVAGVAYGRDSGGSVELGFDSVGSAIARPATGTLGAASVLSAKLGLGFQIPAAVPALLTVAPALVRVVPGGQPTGALDRTRPVDYPAVALGAEISFPTYLQGLFIQVSAEDDLVFTGRELSRRVDRHFLVETGAATLSRVSAAPTHLVRLRAGLSMHF